MHARTHARETRYRGERLCAQNFLPKRRRTLRRCLSCRSRNASRIKKRKEKSERRRAAARDRAGYRRPRRIDDNPHPRRKRLFRHSRLVARACGIRLAQVTPFVNALRNEPACCCPTCFHISDSRTRAAHLVRRFADAALRGHPSRRRNGTPFITRL